MKEYVDVQVLKQQDFQDYSKTDVQYAIDHCPRADVVPRAEYEELVYKLECLLFHATGGKLSKHTYDLLTMESVVTDYIDEAYSEGTAEGAKTEAEKVFAEIYEDCFDQFGYIDYDALDQLKKKYTEGAE